MFEHPPHSHGIAFRIAGPPNGIVGKANAEQPSNCPVRDAVAEEVEEHPGCDHGYNGGGFRGAGTRQRECETCGGDAGKLKRVPGED